VGVISSFNVLLNELDSVSDGELVKNSDVKCFILQAKMLAGV